VRDQNLLEETVHQNKFIGMLPRGVNTEEVKRQFARAQNGQERWEAYVKVLDGIQDKKDLTR